MRKYILLIILLVAFLYSPQTVICGKKFPCKHLPLLQRYETAGLVQHTAKGGIVIRLIADLHFADCGAPDCYETNITIAIEPLTNGDACIINNILVITENYIEKGCMTSEPAESYQESYFIDGDFKNINSSKIEKITLRNMDQSWAIIIMRDNFFYFDDVHPMGSLHTKLMGDDDGNSCCWGAVSSAGHFEIVK